jgi:hypothetical protein
MILKLVHSEKCIRLPKVIIYASEPLVYFHSFSIDVKPLSNNLELYGDLTINKVISPEECGDRMIFGIGVLDIKSQFRRKPVRVRCLKFRQEDTR